MDSDDIKRYAIVGAVVLVLVGTGWFFLRNSAPPAPEPAPGQTLHNPFGTAGTPGAPSTTSASGPGAASQPARAGGPATAPRVPAAGAYDPTVGFGPSAGGPFRKR
jgi:hypothetical protein